MGKMFFRGVFIAIAAFALAGCTQNPFRGKYEGHHNLVFNFKKTSFIVSERNRELFKGTLTTTDKELSMHITHIKVTEHEAYKLKTGKADWIEPDKYIAAIKATGEDFSARVHLFEVFNTVYARVPYIIIGNSTLKFVWNDNINLSDFEGAEVLFQRALTRM